MNNVKTRNLVFIALMTAVLVVMSLISIPMPSGVPITLQTFGVALVGCLLGWKAGAVTVLVYIMLGAVGVPVFSGGRGGMGVLLSVTGGFIWGFVPYAMLCGIKCGKHEIFTIIFAVLGLIVCHIAGVVQYSLVSGNNIWISAAKVSLPYLVKDLISVAAAYCVSKVLKRVTKFSFARAK